MVPKVENLNYINPSNEALEVTRQPLAQYSNTHFVNAKVSDTPLPASSQGFSYSLGVLYHVP